MDGPGSLNLCSGKADDAAERKKRGDVTTRPSRPCNEGPKGQVGWNLGPSVFRNHRWSFWIILGPENLDQGFVWSSHPWGFKHFQNILINWKNFWQLIFQVEMGARRSNFFGPGFHFCLVVFVVISSHDGVHRYFSMSAITCLNKSYLWNCLMDSGIGCRWTMGGWYFDDRLPLQLVPWF